MSKYIQDYPSVLLRFDETFAYVTLTDFGEGRGLMQIHSDWGQYAHYWGSMGSDIVTFLAGTSMSYVHSKLRSSANAMGMKKEFLVRLDRFMINSWPAIHEELLKRKPKHEGDTKCEESYSCKPHIFELTHEIAE